MKQNKVILWFELLIAFGALFPIGSIAWAQSSPSGTPPVKTVFVIIEENKNWSRITPSAAPYIRNTLVPMGAHAEQYYTPPGLHPSEPNYIWMEAGSNLGIMDDADPSTNHRNTPAHLISYLDQAGVSWKAYVENIDGKSCPLTSTGLFGVKHVPFLFFDNVTGSDDPNSAYCISHIRPYSELASDLSNNTVARYNFITPNLCNDMHDCTVTAGDTWLATETPKIFASKAYRDGGALFLTWDEGEDELGHDSDGPIGMIVVSAYAKTNYSNTIHYTHSSFLRTLQEIFGVTPLLADAANAVSLSDLFVSGPPPAAVISDGGIVNNAGYDRASPAIAPGMIVAVFGSNLTDGSSCLPPACNPVFGANGTLNTNMNGTEVLLNGIPAPMFYSSPGQLGIQVPTELAGSSAAVQVRVQGQASLSRTVSIAPASPGIFSYTADGKGSGAISHADGSPISPQTPARAGELVTLYATGLGQVAPAVATGMLPRGISAGLISTSVAVDGITVIPDFYGLSACCVGLDQVNFRLPSNIRSADDIPVFLTTGGVRSNQVTISVR